MHQAYIDRFVTLIVKIYETGVMNATSKFDDHLDATRAVTLAIYHATVYYYDYYDD